MGWRDVQAGVASGAINYKPKEDKLGSLLEGFASVYVPAMQRKASKQDAADTLKAKELKDQKKAEEIERRDRLKEKRKESEAEEKLQKQMKKDAVTIINGIGLDSSNTNLIGTVFAELQSNGGNYDAARERFETLQKDNRLEVVDPAQSFYGNRSANSTIGVDNTPQSVTAQMDQAFDQSISSVRGDNYSSIKSSLSRTESGGNIAAETKPDSKGRIFGGELQFGDDRLADYNRANGTNYRASDMKSLDAETQNKIADWHFGDIDNFIKQNGLDKYIGQEINGTVITKSSLLAMAHLGGSTGMKEYLETDGRSDPDDINGTKLSSYAATHRDAGDDTAMIDGMDRSQGSLNILPVGSVDAFDYTKLTKENYRGYVENIRQKGNDAEAAKVISWVKDNLLSTSEIDYSKITSKNYEGIIRNLERDNRPQDAADVRTWVTATLIGKDPIQFSRLTKTNYEGRAQELENEGRGDEALTVRSFGAAQFSDDPLTFKDLQGLDSTILRAMASSPDTSTDAKTLIDSVLVQENNEELKALGGKSDDNLTSIAKSPAIYGQDVATAAQVMLESRNAGSFDITKYDDIKDATIKVIIDTPDTEDGVKVMLQSLMDKRKIEASSEPISFMKDSPTFMTSYTDASGNLQAVTTMLSASGQHVNTKTGKIIPARNLEAVYDLKLLDDQNKLLTQMENKVLSPVRQSRDSAQTMLASAAILNSYVDPSIEGSFPDILTTVGSTGSRFFSRIDEEISAFNNLLSAGASEEELMSSIDSRALAFVDESKLKGQARAAYLFEAELLKFAYTFASSTLEQRGAGLSNKDFEKAKSIVKAGNDYVTFAKSLKSQVTQGLDTAQRKITSLAADPRMQNLKILDPNGRLTDSLVQDMETWMSDMNLSEQYTWAYSDTVATAGPNITKKTGPVDLNIVVNEYKNSPIFKGDRDTYQNASEKDKLLWISILNKERERNGQPTLPLEVYQNLFKQAQEGK